MGFFISARERLGTNDLSSLILNCLVLPDTDSTCLWLRPLRTADKPAADKQVGTLFEFLAFCDAISRAEIIAFWMHAPK